MIEIIIPIAVVFLVLFLFFAFASKAGGKMIKERQEKISRAESGKATIIGYSTEGLRGTGSGGHFQAYKFTLEVSSEYKSTYKTTAVWEVYPMAIPALQEGKEVNVRIDADDQNIIYPNMPSVEYSWNGAIIDAGHKQ